MPFTRSAILVFHLFIKFQSEMPSRVPVRAALRCRMLPRYVLLDYGPYVLRRMALHRLPLHARSLAYPDIHCQLHSPGTARLFQRVRRTSGTETTTQVLANKRLRIRRSLYYD